MNLRRIILSLAAAIVVTLSLAWSGAGSASAADAVLGPDLAAISSYCQQLPGGSGVAVVPPGDAYSYRCTVNGQNAHIDMTAVCRSINGNDSAVYDRLDLFRFEHPDDVTTGWDCYRFNFNPTTPGQRPDLDRYCRDNAVPAVKAVLLQPGRAIDWRCEFPDGSRSGQIAMDSACRSQNSISWIDRTLNVYDPNSIYCYR